jgi:hypothetical protein
VYISFLLLKAQVFSPVKLVVKCIDGRGHCCTMFGLNVERNLCFSAHTVRCDPNVRAISQRTSNTFIGNLSDNYFKKCIKNAIFWDVMLSGSCKN